MFIYSQTCRLGNTAVMMYFFIYIFLFTHFELQLVFLYYEFILGLWGTWAGSIVCTLFCLIFRIPNDHDVVNWEFTPVFAFLNGKFTSKWNVWKFTIGKVLTWCDDCVSLLSPNIKVENEHRAPLTLAVSTQNSVWNDKNQYQDTFIKDIKIEL